MFGSHRRNGVLSTRGSMDNPLAKYLSQDHVDRKLLDQLAYYEKMAELGRLSAGVIHEINTPLSVIAAASQMVLDEKGLSDSAVEMIERIHSEVQRLSRLTRGLLSFAREEEVTAETDVNDTLREILTLLRYESQKSSITLTDELDYQLPAINADVNRLKQIFMNILVNAFHAMPEGGSVLVSSSRYGDNFVIVRISDTGTGIPEAVLKRIFNPFFTTKEPGQGTGLGLFITKNNIEALGGRIEVESEEGRGTCFSLFFPAIAGLD